MNTRARQRYGGYALFPQGFGLSARRRVAQSAGLAMIFLAFAVGLALATWSVHDPSFLNATSQKVNNALGRPGAFVADFFMQIFGLASVVVVVPLSLWGLRLMRQGTLVRDKWRLFSWLLGIALTAGFASHLPASGGWPLPSGLGGAMGDALRAMPQRLFGTQGHMTLISGLCFALLSAVCLFYAARARQGTHEAPRDVYAESPVEQEDDDELADGDDDRVGFVSIGAVAHFAYVVRSFFARSWRRIATVWAAEDDEPRYELRDVLSRAAGTSADDEDDDDVADVYRRPQQGQAPVSSRITLPLQNYSAKLEGQSDRVVAPPANPLKNNRRLEREAQPSLLDEGYQIPPVALLAEPKKVNNQPINTDALEQNARLLEGVLDDFGVKGDIVQVRPGPVVTLYELEPAPGIKSSRVIGLADDVARSMSAVAARVAVVPGRNAIGIELPNTRRETVYLRELIAAEDFDKSKFKLPLCLGKTIGGEPVIADLARMPHLLIAGTTGSGKSVAINTMILSLLYRLKPEECRLIMVDPKMLELSVYDSIPHLLTPVVTDPKKAVVALKWAVHEMEERYRKMSKFGVRNIDGFNQRVAEAKASGQSLSRTVQTGYDPETGEAIYEQEDMELEPLPYIVVIVDEMADLMLVAGKDIEGAIQRLAQMARAAGIHLIMATQRPSVDVITGTIKANFPTRISFQVTSKIDSRTILGEMGAEQLLGQGDMLYMAGGGRISRVHGPYVSDGEVEKIVEHLKAQGRPQYLDAVTRDLSGEDGESGMGAEGGAFGDESGDLYDRAVAIVLRDRKVSTSYVQRRLQVGYNKAASIIERMENEGLVSAPNHSGKREILVRSSHDDAA